jgi:septum formation protein
MTKQPWKLILASRSPRRRELLTAAGYDFEVVLPAEEAEGGECAGETPPELVARLARQKAADVVGRISELGCDHSGGSTGRDSCTARLVIGCDTVAECEGRILGKPADRDDARAMLEFLSGREHRVLSGLCLWPMPEGEPAVQVAVTTLQMDVLTPERLDAYIADGQWEGKAGAFGYQDGLDWVHVIEGSESNVVGLPMELLSEMLQKISTRQLCMDRPFRSTM